MTRMRSVLSLYVTATCNKRILEGILVVSSNGLAWASERLDRARVEKTSR